MKFARVCGHELYVPDNVAEWDAVAGDSPWELERMESMLSTLKPGDVLYDIGAEHGWMSAIYAQKVGGENMLLVEPSSDFWPNIKGCWDYNGLGVPFATAEAFCGAKVRKPTVRVSGWPVSAKGPECPAMAYRHPNHHPDLPVVTIDWLSASTGRPPKGITIDVEGAEMEVLRGAHGTLLHDRPHVWVSIHPDLMERDFGATPYDLFSYLADVNYVYQHLRTDHEQHWHAWPEEW